ncbi:MAG TPA: glycosyltransferase family 4 protein, partial [Nitrospiria bacterium]|nr:glycosyltransferase family 4 protein [Nitrospiria bacterium]
GIPETHLKLIYNGIDPSTFSVPRGKYRALYRIPEKAFVTGIISNIHYPKGKGHFSIIQSIPNLLEKIPEAWWIIGGSGPMLPELIGYARKLNVWDRIIFTGNLSFRQVPHILSTLDLFVLLSYDQEGGCPLSIMEAMASGLPVIASTTGGNREIVEDGRTGFLIAPEDRDSLIKQTIHLYENPERRKQMGEEGKKRINEFFNYKRMADETNLYYRTILS